MSQRTHLPIALTIAGSDSGGGAGVQADLKTFAALAVHGTSAITCVTAQNPSAVTAIQAIRPGLLQQQIEAVFAELPPAAVKTGMLFSTALIQVVVGCFARGPRPPLIVDPVMVATSGAVLLRPDAIRLLRTRLLPLATLVTPNLEEAEILVGRKLTSLADLEAAAQEIHRAFGCAALVKGGHLRTTPGATDIFYDGQRTLRLVAPFVAGVSTHGTGCTYSAAITAFLARGKSLPAAVAAAKRYITRAIRTSYRAGDYTVLQHGSRRG